MSRLSRVVLATLLILPLAALPAAAHHDDGKVQTLPPSLAAIQHEFANTVAPNAAEDSSAPTGFAPCVDGLAADTYPCDGIDMLSHLTLDDLGVSYVNEIWGWTDPMTGIDYALVGAAEGMVIVDVSDAKRPDVVGILPTAATGAFIWRDIKVYENHAFVVSEDAGHGMQVLDLTEVRGVTGDPVTFSETAYYDGIGRAHNVAINTDTGYAYVIGAASGTESGCEGGLHMIDIADPAAPTFAGCFADHGYIHDAQCVIYHGPDADFQGREICFNAAAQFFGFSPAGIVNTLSVVDVTDKSNPVPLANYEYADDGYSHQGWLTPDHAYFLHNDELDEFFGQVSNTTTRIFDVGDLDGISEPVQVAHPNTAIGHNAYAEGSHLFASNYTSGLRVYSTTDVAAGELPEEAWFDVYPQNDDATFEGGSWGNYPFFSQKKLVAVGSQERGLFMLRPRLGR